jgi:hypothetical protein
MEARQADEEIGGPRADGLGGPVLPWSYRCGCSSHALSSDQHEPAGDTRETLCLWDLVLCHPTLALWGEHKRTWKTASSSSSTFILSHLKAIRNTGCPSSQARRVLGPPGDRRSTASPTLPIIFIILLHSSLQHPLIHQQRRLAYGLKTTTTYFVGWRYC